MGGLLRETGKSAVALAALRLARDDQEALAAAPEASSDARYDLANTVLQLGALLGATGKPSEEEAGFRRCWRSSRSWPTTTPPSPNSVAAWPGATTASGSG